MQTENWKDFDLEVALLCEAYDRKKTAELLDSYWTALARMSIGHFKIAALYAREKSGTEGYDRIPKPGRFWSLRDEAIRQKQRGEVVASRVNKIPSIPRETHLAVLRRLAITFAQREHMPKLNGKILGAEFAPEKAQTEYKLAWKSYADNFLPLQDADYLERAHELMAQWGEKNSRQTEFGDALAAMP